MEELITLRDRLRKTGKDESVRVALEALLLAPDDVDLQIDVLGAAHRANWLPNRKAVFWKTFSIDGEQWVSRCVTRVMDADCDANALSALLNSNVLAVATVVQAYSPDLVLVWDVSGAQFCGIALARHQRDKFNRYFYIGWEAGGDTIHRLDYIPCIKAPLGRGHQRLDEIASECEMLGGFWTELPYGFGCLAGSREFTTSVTGLKPYGYTEAVRRHLGC